MNQFVFLKLVNGEQLMALKESEDLNTITIKFPMLVKTHLIGQKDGRISEQVTAGPYSLFTESEEIHINKEHVILDTLLAERAIPHYVSLVREHEGVIIKYTPKSLHWEDEIPADAPEEVDVAKVLDALKAIANEEPTEEVDNTYVEGNKTIH